MLKITKRCIVLFIVFTLTFNIFGINASASPLESWNIISEEEAEKLGKSEDYVESTKTILNEEINYNTKSQENVILQEGTISPFVVVPSTGSTKIVNYTYGHGLVEKVEQDKEAGIYKNIKSAGMLVAGIFIDDVEGVVLGALDIAGSNINVTGYTNAKTFLSYRYIGKEAQVYTGSRWQKYYDARSREVFKHYWASHLTEDNYTMTDTQDYTRLQGYGPVKVEYSPNFRNESELRDRAWHNWKMGGGYRYPEYW